MATRNIVPRANDEGQVGTSTKNWLTGFLKTINILGEAILKQISTPSNPSSGYNKIYFKSDNKIYKLTSAGTETEVGASGAAATNGTFTNASLSTGKLTITHNKALSSPYQIVVFIFDNNYKEIIPDEITGSTNSVEIDLTSYGTLSGTWGYSYIA
jgi:hypothetical protein